MEHYYYEEYFGKGQQKIEIYLYESRMPTDDPVYTLKNILEEMDFSRLFERYSNRGRTGYNPIMIFAIILYANMRGIFSADKIVECCKRDIGFIWLSGGEQPRRDVFYEFINNRVTLEVLEDLHYQFIRNLHKKGYLTLKRLFLDGTKIEANANRYTFIWRGSINYHLINLLDKTGALYEAYNAFIVEHGYDGKYGLVPKEMFIVEGEEKVRKTIEENKRRKRNTKKKLSNNKLLEIDHMSPLELLSTALQLKEIAASEGVIFVNQKGHRKHTLQKLYEQFVETAERLMKYKDHFEIMGTDRNSYSKTDLEATFMRMKEDHMKNGQLKPAYNVQYAMENYFIVHVHVSNDRTDYNTLIPVAQKHKTFLEVLLEEFIADSGYCSERNLLYLKAQNIEAFIKLQEHEQKKTRKYQQNIGKYYNMEALSVANEQDQQTKAYRCHDNRILHHIKTEIHKETGFERAFEVYACQSCDGCSYKSGCLYQYDPQKNPHKTKVMKVNERWDELKRWSEANVLSEKGIRYRQIRSVETEGSFGDMKENDKFRRFHRRGMEKVTKEIMLYAFARNLNKYDRFERKKLQSFEGNAA